MRLRIDGRDISLDLPAGSTFRALLAEAGSKVTSEGRVVSRIVADGQEISTRFEREMADRPVGEIGTVEITTTAPRRLLREALDGAVDLSLAIRRDVVTLLTSLRTGDLAAVDDRYATCIESLGTFFQLAGAVFNAIGTGVFPLALRPGSAGSFRPLPTLRPESSNGCYGPGRGKTGTPWRTFSRRRSCPTSTGGPPFFKALRRSARSRNPEGRGKGGA